MVRICLIVACVFTFAIPHAVFAADCNQAYAGLKSIAQNERQLLKRQKQYPQCGKLSIALADYYYGKQIWQAAGKQYGNALGFYPENSYLAQRKKECADNTPIAFSGTRSLDLSGEIRTRGLGGAKKLPPLAMEVHFSVGSAVISSNDRAVLDQFALLADRFKEYQFDIQGHTDADGSEAYNERLSQQRAQAVKAYLEDAHAIPSGRLHAKGYGETHPIATNLTEEGKSKNRRVEFRGYR